MNKSNKFSPLRGEARRRGWLFGYAGHDEVAWGRAAKALGKLATVRPGLTGTP
jgi:hypothetical protein